MIKSGSRQVSFRYAIIRDGAAVAGGIPVISASISHDSTAEIKRTARFEIGNDNRINWLTDCIKPYMRIVSDRNDAEYPLGEYLPISPTRNLDDTVTYTVEAYDQSIILREDCLISRLYIASGTEYLSAVQTLLEGAGISRMTISPSSLTLPTDREFEIGTSKLEIINTLLAEINYNSVSVNADGVFVITPFVEPSVASITKQYYDGKLSVIGRPSTTDLDLYSVPNIFLAVCDNPDMTTSYRSVYTNDNPASPLSTVQRGRNIVSEIYRPDAITSQAALDDYIRRKAFEASQTYETVQFYTALMPEHEDREILDLRHPDFAGVYIEESWEMQLQAGGQMTHTARRIMSI